MKGYIRRIAAALSLGIFVLPAVALPAQPQKRPWWFYGYPQGIVAQIPGNIPNPGSAGWTQYQSCLQQNLSVSPQQSAQIAPISCQRRIEGNSDPNQQFAFGRSEDTRG